MRAVPGMTGRKPLSRSSTVSELASEPDVAAEGRGPRGKPPAWDELWPPRRDRGPEVGDTPVLRQATPTGTGDAGDVEGGVDLTLGGLTTLMETRHTELVAQTMSALDAIRASTEAALGAIEKRMADHLQRVEAGAAGAADLAALRLHVDDTLQSVVSAATDESSLDALEERLSSSIRETRGEIEGRSAELVRRLEVDVKALRTDLLAAVAEHVDARAGALEREVARERALETRLRSELEAIVGSELAALRLADDAGNAMTERIDRVETQVARLSGELGGLRTQLAETHAAEVAEVRDDMDRLSKSMEGHRAETATRTDLVALEDRVAKDLVSAQSEVDSRMTRLDAVVDAVDAAAASLDTRFVERLTGMADVAASTAVAPVRNDLRAVHDEVAATQRSIRELRRRVRASLRRDGSAGSQPG